MMKTMLPLYLLGNEYTHLDYCRRPMRHDLGKKMLYRDAHMTGWTYKEITVEDLKFPLVYGEGKRSRLLATIGVTRGFGDHDLKAQTQNGHVFIKPFLTPQPEVRVLDVENEDITQADTLIMGTDGLWDVVSNEKVAETVRNGIKLYEDADELRKRYCYITVAQDLVMSARGKLIERNWRRTEKNSNTTTPFDSTTEGNTSDGTTTFPATIDDISVFVIPILPYKEEYQKWKLEAEAKHAKLKKASETTKHSNQAQVTVEVAHEAKNGVILDDEDDHEPKLTTAAVVEKVQEATEDLSDDDEAMK